MAGVGEILSDYMRQDDPQWALDVMPGGATLRRAGCTLTALCVIKGHLDSDDGVTPRHALTLGVQADAFVTRTGQPGGNLLHVERLAPLLGLTAGAHVKMRQHGRQAMADEIVAVLAEGCALLWVDHDSTLESGDDDGDHYIAALYRDGASIVCGDPADGRERRIDLATLEGPSPYVERPYRIRGVRGIRRHIQAVELT